jgi:hypothetical protein
MRRVLLGMIVSIIASAAGVQAQQAGAGAGPNNSGPGDLNRQRVFEEFQVGVADSNRLTTRQGLDVHDSKGLVIGKVESVGKSFATVSSAIGSVEVDFTSFAKNKNGLLINMPKSKIDVLMARGHPVS